MTVPHPTGTRFRPRPARPRRLLGAVLGLALAAAALVGLAPAAAAHSELTGSDPAAGAELSAVPEQVRLTFNERVEPQFATIALTTGDGQAQVIPNRVEGAEVVADVPPEVAAAAGEPTPWRITYRVVSGDGHPISGTIDFTVTAPAATPSPSATDSAAASAAPSTAASTSATPAPATPDAVAADPVSGTDSSVPWGWVVGGLVLLVLIAGAVAVLARRSRSGPA